MLDITNAISRRSFLKVGALGAAGLSLPTLLRAQADERAPSDTSVILLWCSGGPTQFETYDPKPNAPAEYRGPLRPIRTNVAGMDIGELLPRHAAVANRFTLVRSCAHNESGHGSATKNVMSGHPHPPGTNEGTLLNPSVGSVVAKVRERERRLLPPYTWIPSPSIRSGAFTDTGSAYLGAAYNPFGVDPKKGAEGLMLPNELTVDRLTNRRQLLGGLDRFRRDLDSTGMMEGIDAFTRQAFEMVTGPAARQALDLTRENAQTRARYGNHDWGQSCMLARRLVEAGVGFVAVNFRSWDDHSKIEDQMKKRAPQFDSAVAGLIEDLHERGLDRKVTVLVLGEFGRTPRVNNNGGRDHWPSSMSVLMAGGGMKVGQVIGSTNDRGERPRDRQLHPNDVWATVFKNIGVDYHQTFVNNAGRPVHVLPSGEPIAELY